MKKIIFLIIANLIALFVISFFLDFFGISYFYRNSLKVVTQYLESEEIPSNTFADQQEEIEILDSESREKLIKSLQMKEKDLLKKEKLLEKREEEILANLSAIEQEKETLLLETEKLKQEKKSKENYEKKVSDLATQFTNMIPEKAVERLLLLKDDILILDILRKIGTDANNNGTISLVPYFYSLMPKDDAARLLKKSTLSL